MTKRKPKRVNNKDMGRMATYRDEFINTNNTCYGEWASHIFATNLYIVYSYGRHFPIYIWDDEALCWYGNSSKYSNTTTRHQNNARPTPQHGDIIWVETDRMLDIINSGGTVNFVARRMEEVPAVPLTY